MERLEKLREALRSAIAEARAAIDKGESAAVEASRAKVTSAQQALADEQRLLDAEAQAGLKAEQRAQAQREADKKAPAPAETRDTKGLLTEIRTAMAEKRAITVNGTGATAVVAQIVKELIGKMTLTQKYRYFFGPNASTVIPILSPGLATPAGQSEGATGVGSDATAVVSAVTLLPKAYVSILPVSAEALLLSGADIEANLPGIFADAFAKALFGGSLTGDGTGNNMLGMFVDAALTNNVECAVAGAPTLLDLAKLALTVQDYADDAIIVLNPGIIATMLAETTAESAPIKQELMTSRSCMGVPIVMTGSAPSVVTAGSIVGVAMPMSNYGVAMAQELVVDPIKVKGDTNTYFQATMFFNGKPIVPKNGWQLVTK